MSIIANAGNISMFDSAGNKVFDTNEKLFHATDFLSGTVTIANIPANQAWALRRTAIGTCNPLSTQVTGAWKPISYNSAVTGGFKLNTWFCAGGSHYLGGANYKSNRGVLAQWSMAFEVINGTVYLTEDRISSNTFTGFGSTLVGFTMQYKLWIGGWN